MQYLLEHFGVGVAAITGVLAARGKRVDLFGVIVLALVTALGGGTMRDLLLGAKPMWVLDPRFLLNAAAVAVVTFFLVRYRQLPEPALVVADAFALAFFTTIGVKKALGFEASAAIGVAMGVITGVVGGILRDTLTGEIPLVFRREIHLYATAAFCGALVFALLNKRCPSEQGVMVMATATTLALRLAGIRWKIGLPVFKHRETDGLEEKNGRADH